MTNERETVVVSGSGSNGAGWFIAGVAVVALIVIGALAYNGYFSDNTATIELKVPELPVPSN